MTPADLKSLTDNLSDVDFLAHPEVRRLYWNALHRGTGHDWSQIGDDPYCLRCDALKRVVDSGGLPCRIPGSIADAADELRKNVCRLAEFRNEAAIAEEKIVGSQPAIFDTPRQRFIVYAAALGEIVTDESNGRMGP